MLLLLTIYRFGSAGVPVTPEAGGLPFPILVSTGKLNFQLNVDITVVAAVT